RQRDRVLWFRHLVAAHIAPSATGHPRRCLTPAARPIRTGHGLSPPGVSADEGRVSTHFRFRQRRPKKLGSLRLVAPLLRDAPLDHLEVIQSREHRKWRMRLCLIPECCAGDIVLQRQVALLPLQRCPPAERLDRHPYVAREADGIHYVPPV